MSGTHIVPFVADSTTDCHSGGQADTGGERCLDRSSTVTPSYPGLLAGLFYFSLSEVQRNVFFLYIKWKKGPTVFGIRLIRTPSRKPPTLRPGRGVGVGRTEKDAERMEERGYCRLLGGATKRSGGGCLRTGGWSVGSGVGDFVPLTFRHT